MDGFQLYMASLIIIVIIIVIVVAIMVAIIKTKFGREGKNFLTYTSQEYPGWISTVNECCSGCAGKDDVLLENLYIAAKQ